MNYTDTIELVVGFEVIEPNRWLFKGGPMLDVCTLKYEIEGFSIIRPFECEEKKGEMCICELRTVDNRFAADAAFFVEDGKTIDDKEVKELISEHLAIARKKLGKKIWLHLVEQIRTSEAEQSRGDAKENKQGQMRSKWQERLDEMKAAQARTEEFRAQNIV